MTPNDVRRAEGMQPCTCQRHFVKAGCPVHGIGMPDLEAGLHFGPTTIVESTVYDFGNTVAGALREAADQEFGRRISLRERLWAWRRWLRWRLA